MFPTVLITIIKHEFLQQTKKLSFVPVRCGIVTICLYGMQGN